MKTPGDIKSYKKGELLSKMLALATNSHAGQFDKVVALTSCIHLRVWEFLIALMKR